MIKMININILVTKPIMVLDVMLNQREAEWVVFNDDDNYINAGKP